MFAARLNALGEVSTMAKYSELKPAQKRIYDACSNGWYMGGKYRALLDGHQHDFFADTKSILAREIEPWYAGHQEHHGQAPLLVKCVQVL